MTEREVAWRVFAGEYNASTLDISPAHEREPGYLITPLGAKINRVYIVGVLTEVEKFDRNGNSHYRARISDRTGVFYVYAGQYNPEVTKILSKLEPPTYVAVIGKSKIYSPSEGITYVSIRPENIKIVDKNIRDYWLLDACKSMKERLSAVTECQQLVPPDMEKLVALGYDELIARGVMDALEHYKKLDTEYYHNMLTDVLKYLVTEKENGYVSSENTVDIDTKDIEDDFKTGDELTTEPEDSEDTELEFEPSDETGSDPSEPQVTSEHEELLLKIISSLKGKKYNDGVPWHDLMVKATDGGLDKNIIEDIVNSLLNTGKVYEPMLGRIKCTSTSS